MLIVPSRLFGTHDALRLNVVVSWVRLCITMILYVPGMNTYPRVLMSIELVWLSLVNILGCMDVVGRLQVLLIRN